MIKKIRIGLIIKEDAMLICEQCGDTYFTATPELFQKCESCGGKLKDVTHKKKGGRKKIA